MQELLAAAQPERSTALSQWLGRGLRAAVQRNESPELFVLANENLSLCFMESMQVLQVIEGSSDLSRKGI